MVENVYFELTRAFNAHGPVVVLASGQAVVYHRVAIMSKDGDWILRESPEACARVLDVLAAHGARYRAGAPLDVAWLAGGWSSHFEFADERGRRVRCDFFSRPPRVTQATVHRLLDQPADPLRVVDIETLIVMKQTQRAKDYAVIGELASRLPPERELAFTTDPDRLLALATALGTDSPRQAVQAAIREGRDATIVALARETDALQRQDRQRLDAYAAAAEAYVRALANVSPDDRRLPRGHDVVRALADRFLPTHVHHPDGSDVPAQ